MTTANGSGPTSETTSYHGQPVLKEPVWTWEIPLYFHTGGVAGASAGLAYLSGLQGNEVLAKRCWAIALASVGVSPALLTADLGRPVRFINMLRMFKVSSPMSVGSWILAGSGATTAVAAVNAWTGLFPRTGRFAKAAAAALGLPLSTYTAALISNTAVPTWHEARRMLPWVFGGGAALGAGAAAVAVTPPSRASAARRLALGAALLEGPVMELMAHRLGEHGEPYKHGPPALFANMSRACIISGGGLLFRYGGKSRAVAVVAGALLSAGAVATRWSVFRAGFRSAADPKYVVGPQRAAIQRRERRGAARRTAKVRTADPAVGSPATLR
jgi:Polysulphide reductase, NrfD